MLLFNFLQPYYEYSVTTNTLQGLTEISTLEYRMKVPVLLKNTTQKSKRYAIFFAVLLDVTHNFGLRYFYSGRMGKADFREWIKADFREWS